MKTLVLTIVLASACSAVVVGHSAYSWGAYADSTPSSEGTTTDTPSANENFHFEVSPGDDTVTLRWISFHRYDDPTTYTIFVREPGVHDFVKVGCYYTDPGDDRPAQGVEAARCVLHRAGVWNQHTVSNLENGVRYQFRMDVAAIGLFASGTAWATPGAPPEKSPNFLGLPLDGGVILSWSAPDDDGGSPITEYVIAARIGTVNPFDTVATVKGHPDTYTVENLTNGVPYEFVVIARNSIGDGPPSDSITLTPTGEPYCLFFCNYQ